MLAEKYISQSEYNDAVNAPITAKRHGAEIELYAPYISEMVRAYMVEKYGTDTAYNSGFRVYTTIDAATQAAAQKALIDNLHAYDKRHGFRGPTATFWQEDERPWPQEKIIARLQKVKAIAPFARRQSSPLPKHKLHRCCCVTVKPLRLTGQL